MTAKSFNQKTIRLHLGNIYCKLCSAAGAALAVELRMRLFGEFSQKIQDKLKELATIKKQKDSKYWSCKLSLLDQAIIDVFGEGFSKENLEKIEGFRPLRNALLHGDFVTLMEKLGIEPTGREIGRDMKRNILDKPEIVEAIKSIDRNNGFAKCETKAKEVITILDDFLSHTDLD